MTFKSLSKTVSNGTTHTFMFPSKVSSASTLVQGYTMEYSDRDHHVREQKVKASITSVSGNTVSVSATCEMFDDSNKRASGSVDILCMAELE
ncbi:hypothetical protein [Paenibacillus sp. ISL-20]|uniref:hypothetical protein n=1 Tax=Paenibacillus sp. ISL-20 TaxID=2819163 RepID=UPI001BECCDCE|nr:hypothetical protein [Paenibacillus sp. ISL-20]MBT2765564.1 hypothetical protein [Paenibacillus sp. ISL-20]